MSQLSQGEAYSLLGLPIGADRDAVKTSFKRLAQKWHPEKHQNSDDILTKFKNICRAYMRLTTDNDTIIMDNKEMFQLYNSVIHPKSQRMKAAIVKNELYNNCENGDSNKLIQKNSTDNNSNLYSTTNYINNENHRFINTNSLQTNNFYPTSQNIIIPQYENENSQNSHNLSEAMVLESRQLAIGGNALAMDGLYNDAIENFSKAISLDPSDFRFYGNRSFCYERLEQYSDALSDSIKAISLQPEWAKGYFRKGKALAGLKNYGEAEEAFLQVLKLDSKCQDARHELTKVQEHQLVEMGFSLQLASLAIGQCNNVQTALESLLAGTITDKSSNCENHSDDESIKGNRASSENPSPETNESTNLGSGLSKSEHSIPNSVKDTPFVTQKYLKNSNQNISNQKPQNSKNQKAPIPPIPQHHYEMAQKQILLNSKQDVIKMNPRNPEGLTSLWVGNILPDVKQEELTKLFSKYGQLQSVKCMPEKFCAFINFSAKDCAGKAMECLQGADVHGQKLLIKFPDHPVPSLYQNGGEKNKTSKEVNLKNGTSKATQQAVIAKQAQQQAAAAAAAAAIDRTKGPVNGDECYFWRTTGCQFSGTCRYRHLPEHKGIDKKPWHKPGAK